MSVTNTKNIIIRGGVVGIAIAVGIFAACAKKGPPRPTCEDVSDAGANASNLTPYTTVSTDARPIEAFGMEPDPGPQCTDCRQDDTVEIMTISDFEEAFAPAWFKYGEPGVFIDPLQAGEPINENGSTSVGQGPPQPWWGLQVSTLSDLPGGERCGSKYALHMLGGPFTSWGGGYVTRHFTVRGEYMTRCSPDGRQCFCRNGPSLVDGGLDDENGIGVRPKFMPDSVTNADQATGCIFWASPVATQPSLLGVDLSDFDGVSFWARRGPSGQSSLRVALIDDSVSADLARFQERQAYLDAGTPPDQAGAQCTRIEECCELCREMEYSRYVPEQGPDGGPPVDGGENVPAHCAPDKKKRCHVEGERLPYCRENPDDGGIEMFNYGTGCGQLPEADASDACWTGGTGAQPIWNDWDDDFELCCPPTMDDEDPAERNGDPRYGGSECRPYVFNFDQSSGSYCYDDGEVLPEKNQNRCEEGFEASVVVGPEWKLYTVPWAELRRFTPDKPPIDPHSIWQVAFYFGAGYLDTYVDDVGFYRRRK